jgi:hypothetical protein
MATANPYVGAARAAIGQGLGMGWGDEAEAWLRAKLGPRSYEDQVKQIREEYGQYAKENPYTSGALEFAGGAAPGVAAMMIPGGQAAGAAQLQRSTLGALGRLAATGAATGAVAGAGAANEQDRLTGAGTGAVVGGILGAALPTAMRSTGVAGRWLRDRLLPTEGVAQNRATALLADAVAERGKRQAVDVNKVLEADRILGVPSVVANVSPTTARLAEDVAKRSRRAADTIEARLQPQRADMQARVYGQADKGLHPGDYFADEERLVKELRTKAKGLYDKAYDVGEVNDPQMMNILELPEMGKAWHTARKIADADASAAKVRGEDPSKYALRDVYKATVDPQTNVMSFELNTLPDVRTLDYMKKALDAQIRAGYKSDDAAVLANTIAMKDIRNGLRDRLKAVVPEYKDALSQYKGDAEVIDAMRAGLKEFPSMKPEEVTKLISGMSPAEVEAFRTGVARNIYGQIMTPSGNVNAAQKFMGPTAQAKLEPLFDSPSHFRLFKNAIERESQLFQQSNRVLGASRAAVNPELDQAIGSTGSAAAGSFAASAMTGGFWPSLAHTTLSNLKPGQMTEKTAGKLADMLMAKDPHEVAAVVKLLGEHAAGIAPKAAKRAATETGAVMGTTAAIFPSPEGTPEAPASIEDTATPTKIEGPDIEEYISSLK